MCRAKRLPTKGTINRVCAWVKKGKAWAQTTLANAYAVHMSPPIVFNGCQIVWDGS